jgi:hypothetical protein
MDAGGSERQSQQTKRKFFSYHIDLLGYGVMKAHAAKKVILGLLNR